MVTGSFGLAETSKHSLAEKTQGVQPSQNWLGVAIHYFRLTGSPILFIGKWGKGKNPIPTLYKSETYHPETGELMKSWEQFQQGQTEEDLIAYYRSIDKRQIHGVGLIHGKTNCLDFDDIPPDVYPKIWALISEGIAAGVFSPNWIEDYKRDPEHPENHSIHVWYTPQQGSRYSSIKVLKHPDGWKLEIRGNGQTLAPKSNHKPSGTVYRFITNTDPTDNAPTVTDQHIEGIEQVLEGLGVPRKEPREKSHTTPIINNGDSPYPTISGKAYRTILEGIHRGLEAAGWNLTKKVNRCIFACNHKNGDASPSAYLTRQGEYACPVCGDSRYANTVSLKTTCEQLGVDFDGILKRYPTGTQTRGSNGVASNPAPMPALPQVETKADPSLLVEASINAPTISINERFVSDGLDYKELANYHLVTIKSRLGTGKTEANRRFISQHSLKSVVLITPYNSLNLNFYERFKGFGFQSHLHNKTHLHNVDRASVSLNSLYKMCKGGVVPSVDFLILDEIETMATFLFHGTLPPQESIKALNLLMQFIAKAKHVWALDANYGVGAETFLGECAIRSRVHIDNEYKRKDLAPITFVNYRAKAEHQIKKGINKGERVAVISDSIALITAQQAQYPESTSFILHGENSDDPKIMQAIANINQTLEGVQLFLASPTLQSGVDIQQSFDWVVAMYTTNNMTAEDKAQQVGRFRNVRKGIVIHTPNDSAPENHKSENPTEIADTKLGAYLQNYNLILDIVGEDGLPVLPQKRAQFFEPHQRKHYKLQCTIEAKRNRQINHAKSYLAELLTREGYQIKLKKSPPSKNERETHEEIAHTYEETIKARIENTHAALPISEKDYNELKSSEDRPDNLPQRRDNGEIRELFGYDYDREITLAHMGELYPIWKQRKTEFIQYLWMLMDTRHLAQLDADEMDNRNKHNSMAGCRYRVAKVALLKYLLAKANRQKKTHEFKPDMGITYTHTGLEAFEKAAQKYKRELSSYFGIKVAHYKTRVGLFERVLKEIGLLLEEEKTVKYTDKQGNQREYTVYRINRERLKLLGELALNKGEADTNLGIVKPYPTLPRMNVDSNNSISGLRLLVSEENQAAQVA